MQKNPTPKTPLPLREHLQSYGIIDQARSSTPETEGVELQAKDIRRLERLGKPLHKGAPKQADLFAFYEFISAPRIAAAVHSNKRDAIRVTGEFVQANLTGRRILDIGCHIGYLTSWYAICNPLAEVHGIDLSPSSIHVAKSFAARFAIDNVRYTATDGKRFLPEQPFDSIVDTQGMLDHHTDGTVFEKLFSWLQPGGKLICVPPLGNLEQFMTFLAKLNPASGQIHSLTWLEFSAHPQPGAYPAMIMMPGQAGGGLSRRALIEAYQLGLLDFQRKVSPALAYA